MEYFLFLLVLSSTACGALSSRKATSTIAPLPTAIIDAGTIIGTTTSFPSASAVVNQFLGVPYVASPTRFSIASAPTPWSKPLEVFVRKPSCIQQFDYPTPNKKFSMRLYNTPAPEESEDCLYLNIFAPSTEPPAGGFPVMFWIYGGSFLFGNAGQPFYDGSRLAAYEDVIVVTANYRMGIFGFPNNPALPLTSQNLGFLDQRASLEWVQTNIHAVGGNPAKVTLFGNSAGAKSIDAHIISYAQDAPFRAAILQSGQTSVFDAPLRTTFGKDWRNVSRQLNCTKHEEIECVQKAPATDLKSMAEHGQLSFHPVVDNLTWFQHPAARRAAHNIANVSLLVGTNNDDGSVLVGRQDNVTAFLIKNLPGSPVYQAKVAAEYAIGSTISKGTVNNDTAAIRAMYTDYASQCPQAIHANQSVAAGYPVWRYYFNATFPNIQIYPRLGSYHGEEVYLVFTTFPKHHNLTVQETELSHFMRKAWADFAKDPTGAGPGWNRLGSSGGDLAILGANGSAGATIVEQRVVDDKCAVWNPIYVV